MKSIYSLLIFFTALSVLLSCTSELDNNLLIQNNMPNECNQIDSLGLINSSDVIDFIIMPNDDSKLLTTLNDLGISVLDIESGDILNSMTANTWTDNFYENNNLFYSIIDDRKIIVYDENLTIISSAELYADSKFKINDFEKIDNGFLVCGNYSYSDQNFKKFISHWDDEFNLIWEEVTDENIIEDSEFKDIIIYNNEYYIIGNSSKYPEYTDNKLELYKYIPDMNNLDQVFSSVISNNFNIIAYDFLDNLFTITDNHLYAGFTNFNSIFLGKYDFQGNLADSLFYDDLNIGYPRKLASKDNILYYSVNPGFHGGDPFPLTEGRSISCLMKIDTDLNVLCIEELDIHESSINFFDFKSSNNDIVIKAKDNYSKSVIGISK